MTNAVGTDRPEPKSVRAVFTGRHPNGGTALVQRTDEADHAQFDEAEPRTRPRLVEIPGGNVRGVAVKRLMVWRLVEARHIADQWYIQCRPRWCPIWFHIDVRTGIDRAVERMKRLREIDAKT